MKRTISFMVGKGSQRHNNRNFVAENVDAERTPNNITYCNENIKDVYHELFDEALEKYNAKQTRKDRVIDNYYEKIRTGKQEKPFHEVIVQIGRMEDTHATSENGQLAKVILDEYMKGFAERNPNLRVFSAHLHMDEATPHLHIDFVPFTTGSKRGLETRVTLKKALEAQGFVGTGKRDTEWNRWVAAEKEKLSEIMLEHGIEWDKLGTHNPHRTVDRFKLEKMEERYDELEKECDLIEQRIENYKQSEEQALEKAKTIETETLLPETQPFMSVKAYKKKIEPIFKKLIGIIKTLARKVYELQGDNRLLRQEAEGLRVSNNKLKSQLWDYRVKNSKMEVELRKFDKIKKYFGAKTVKRWLDEIKKSRQKKKTRTEETR